MEKMSKKILAMPVYSVQEGQHLGFVKGLVIDPKERAIAAIIIERRRMSREERIISFQNIASIGDDAITVAKANTAERKSNMPSLISLMRNPVHLIGARVMTVGGKTLGKIEEYRFEGESGKITHLELSGGGNLFKEKIVVKSEHLITIAHNTVMIADAALDETEPLESSLISGMEVAKEKATNAVNATIEASKKITQNISNSINKLKAETLPKEESPQEKPMQENPTQENPTEENPAQEIVQETETDNPYPDEQSYPVDRRRRDIIPDITLEERREDEDSLPVPIPEFLSGDTVTQAEEDGEETGEGRYRQRRTED